MLGEVVLLVLIALAVIFVLLFAAVGGARAAMLVYLNVPLALSGGLIALWLRGLPLSISAAVGFIALFGVAVLNGVVLVSAIRRRERAGARPLEAACDATRERLRAVLMTALVAVVIGVIRPQPLSMR